MDTVSFSKQCPSCNRVITFATKHDLNRSLKNNSLCHPCSHQKNSGSKYYRMRALGKTDDTPKYYVYLIIDPFTNEPFYVGKGNKSRMLVHVAEVRNGKMPNTNNRKLFNRIKAILDAGLEPVYEKPKENMTEIEALALEAAFIDCYGINNLCNYQLSGFGVDMDKSVHSFFGLWGRAVQTFGDAIKNYGSWENFQSYKQSKIDMETAEAKQREIEKAKKGQLNSDLRLLNAVMNSIRIKLEQEAMYKERNIITCDRDRGIFQRECPKCKAIIDYCMYESLMACARNHTTCAKCMGKDVSVNMKKRWSKANQE